MSIHGNAITCREIVEVMTDYLEDKLSGDERLRFEHHLDLCPPCRDYLGQLRTTITQLGRLRTEDAPLPEATRAALLEAFRSYRRANDL